VHRSAPEVPLIVLAYGSDKNCATQSLSQGALDYLLKGFIDTRTISCGIPSRDSISAMDF